MIHNLTPYPAYKKSSVPWLGEVPEHWEIRRLKTVFHEVDRRSTTGAETLLSLRMQLGLVDHHALGGKHIPPESLVGYKCTYPGEIVMNRMRAAAGLFAATRMAGLVSPDYAVLRPRSPISLDYFVHLFRTPLMASMFRLESRGLGTGESGFLRLYTDRFGMLAAPVAPLSEQDAIVRFLGHADRRIRSYIGAKKKLIALLNEQKQAIIHRAVTRGLDPNVRLKSSGVEWLGEVPEHWDVLRSRYVFREVDLRSKSGAETHLSMSQKLGLVLSSMVEQRTLVSESYAGGKLCQEDDLVLNRLKAHLGVFALARQSGVISPDYTVLRKLRPIVVQYFEHILRSPACRIEFRRRTKGIVQGFWRLYTDDFYDIKVPVPPLDEQKKIVEAIGGMTSSISNTIQRAEREIDLLREYRTRLIADVVTGKLDVREAAASLPDEPDEPEPLADADALTEDDETDPDATPEEPEA